ncbi:MAG: helix-turn-helix transcriptional regulator [Betaproteobacteria bacterium]|nr:helix-turn-helix transcriptional regulator [Betaproteobacteria bacterium]
MPSINQQIRFCKSFDGTRLAYAVSGEGPALVKAPHWLTHLEYEWQSPIWRPWIDAFSRNRTFVRMDQRGCGLSTRDPAEISFEALVRDLEAMVDAAGHARFALFGHSQGSAIAVEYAARHPERVSHLVLLGSYARGALKREPAAGRADELQAQLKLIEVGWGRDDASYRQMFSSQFIPGGTLEQLNSMSELQRHSAAPETAVRIISALFSIDVCDTAAQVQCPTLVVHARRDRRVPYEEGVRLAGLIAGAQLLPLDTDNHILLHQEPAFGQFFGALAAFLPRGAGSGAAAFAQLTAREGEVLERIAQGLDNAQIAAHLGLSEKTVRNHITRIFDKLGVENRPQTIVRAREAGLGKG